MRFNNNISIVFTITLFALFITFSAEAICVPRNSANNIASQTATAPQASATTTDEAPAPAESKPQAPASPPPVASPKPSSSDTELQFGSSKTKAGDQSVDTKNPELTRLCALTENPQLCAQVTGPFLKGFHDPVSILRAAMNAALDHLNFAITEAKKQASDASTSPVVKQCVNTCLETYQSALDDFDTSFTAIEQKDIGSLNSHLDAALTMVSTCEDTFDENPGVESPFQDLDRKLLTMIDNCLAIRNAIKDVFSPSVVV